MNIMEQHRSSTLSGSLAEQTGLVVPFPKHPLVDWSRYKPVELPAEDRFQLLSKGYEPLPLQGKACHVIGWNNDKATGHKTDITEAWLSKQLAERPQDEGTGIRCGEVSAIDVDVTDDGLSSDIAYCITEIFGPITLARRGSKGFLVPVNTPQSYVKRTMRFTDVSGKCHQIEVLAEGQQFGAFGHVPPAHGKHESFDYSWYDGVSPLDAHSWELPLATSDTLKQFFALVTERLNARGCTIEVPASHEYRANEKKGTPIAFDDFKRVSRFINPGVHYSDWFKDIGAFIESESLLADAPADFDMDEHVRQYSRGELYVGARTGWSGDTPDSYTGDREVDAAIKSARHRAGRNGNVGYGHLVKQALTNGMLVDRTNLIDSFLDSGADIPLHAKVEVSHKHPRFNLRHVTKDRTETVDFIIDDYIPAGMRGLFYGGEQSLKTTAAVKIGVDIAMPSVVFHGDPKVKGAGYRVRRHGAVVYVAAEDAPGVVARAREAILDRDPDCDPADVPFYVLDELFKITNQQDVDDLITAIEAKLPIAGVELALVVLDTTVFVLDGHLSEDKAETVTLAYEGAGKIIRHFGRRCSVVFLHHLGKDSSKGARGSSNWVSSSEFRYQFKPLGVVKAVDGNRTISYPTSSVAWNEKLKNQPLQQPINYLSRRVVYTTKRVDGDGYVTKTNGSTLLLDVAPYKTAKITAGTLSDIDIVKLIVDKTPAGHHLKLSTLAMHADTYGLLASESEPDKWVEAYRKRIKRLLDDSREQNGPDRAMKFNATVAAFLKCNDTGEVTSTGKPRYQYLFVGQGGKLGVWDKYQKAKAEQKAAANAEASELSGIEDDEDFGGEE